MTHDLSIFYIQVFTWFCKLFPDTKIEQSWFIKQVQQTATAKKILAEKEEDDLRAIWDDL